MNDVRPPSRPIVRPSQRPTPSVDKPAVSSAVPATSTHIHDTPSPALSLVKPKRKWVKRLFVTLVSLLVLLGAATYAAYSWYADALTPYSNSQEQVRLTIDAGTSVSQVAKMLEDKKLIKSAFALELYVRLNNKNDIKAGNYVFTPSQPPTEILTWLNEGRIDTFKLTVLPGKNLAELRGTFKKYGFSDQEIDQTYSAQYQHPLFAGKPAGTSLEGYIYPETYAVNTDTPLQDIVRQGFDLMYKQIQQKGIEQKVAAHNLSLYQAVTLASMVEKEVAHGDQPQVAQVFLTRLQLGMTLGSDVTYKYGAALLGVPATPDVASPYNTRLHAGLPPGPVANFNFAALNAVANPAPGDYLYFVSGDDGTNHFSRTLPEHEANIQKYCQKLCSQN